MSPQARGFTLVEMVVLIIIMAVLSAAAVPAYSRLRDRAVFQTRVGAVVTFLQQARAHAIELKAPVEVRFDPQTDTFTAQGSTVVDAADIPTDMAQTSEGAAVMYQRSLTLPAECRITEIRAFGPEISFSNALSRQETVLFFREDGTCDGLRFTIVQDTGHTAVVTLWPTTGTIDVENVL